ncbi:MAG: hypothetical protein N2505_01655 [Endomicrobia bacterium]|nr:hypothetical protein [Endomicrobiia bacterium]
MKILLYFLVIFIFSCSNPKNLLESGIKNEQEGNYEEAERKYLTIVVKFPQSEYAPEAKYRLGLIYKDIIKNYQQANMWFSEIIKNHKETKFYKLAEVGILESPDYLGALDNNKIILGDVESGGKNMKMMIEFKKIDFDLYSYKCKLYAGEKLVRQEDRFYLKTGQEIREYSVNPKTSKEKDLRYTLILKLPVEVGNKWKTSKENREVTYTIVATDLTVKFKNKIFSNCIKILESYKGQQGIRYLYYASNKGLIKITTSSLRNPQQEFPVLEFIE